MGSLQVGNSISSEPSVRRKKILALLRQSITKTNGVICPGATVYNAYLDGLLKARCTEKAVEVYQRMKRDRCRTNTETYTLMINVYGKVRQSC
jgi:pentatricopeptide repeat protein